MVAQSARGVIDFNQPSMKIQCVYGTHHDAGSTAVASIVVHLEQVSSGRHEHHESVLVQGFRGVLHVWSSSGWKNGWFPEESVAYPQTPLFPLEDENVTTGSEDVEERMSYRRRHWNVWRMWSIMFWIKI